MNRSMMLTLVAIAMCTFAVSAQQSNLLAMMLTLVAIAMCTLGGCKDKLTSANYDSISMGMTLQQIEAILGKGEKQEITGVSISAGGVASSGSSNSQLTMIWKSNGKEVTVTFKDGKAVNKGQFGVQ